MTIREYTERAVRKYLRTVLFVDDQLFGSTPTDSLSDNDDSSVLSPLENTLNQDNGVEQGESQADTHVDDSRHEQEEPENIQEETESDSFTQHVIDGFVKQGIVCGLYQPDPSDFAREDGLNQMRTLCEQADVFILDWKLENNNSKSFVVPRLLAQLLKNDEQGEAPRPIRFCAIYTHRRLSRVYEDLLGAIHKDMPLKHIEDDESQWLIRLEGVTIRLYRKNDYAEDEGQTRHFVAPSDLAETIIQDFVDEYKGIMLATALCGIAAVRDNAKRILDKFPPALDFALMVQGGLTAKNPTVPEDLKDLIADEIHSVLSGERLVDDELFSMFSEKAREVESSVLEGVFEPSDLEVNKTTEDIKSYCCSLFKRPFSPDENPIKACKQKDKGYKKIFEKIQNLVIKLSESDLCLLGALPRLFCLRTVYEQGRSLKAGTVVRNLSDNKFYLCLMPPCDCVRLGKKPTRFPFWELIPLKNMGRGHAHGIVVQDGNGAVISLCLTGKIRKQMRFWEFLPDGEVAFQKDTQKDSRYILEENLTDSSEKTRFEWIAELKPLHAQRMAEYVSRQFSRVGLAESEWLRLQMDR